MRLKWWCWLLFPLPLLAEERDPFQPRWTAAGRRSSASGATAVLSAIRWRLWVSCRIAPGNGVA